jgi:regulator of sigma E protease
MSLLNTILWFLVAIAILVVVHEFGHYLAARWAGVKVLRFSVGFGKPLISRRYGRDQTEWMLAAIPLGGYVKMLDEREGDVAEADAHRSFNRASVGKRIVIVVAGPLANFLLAIVFYAALLMHGLPELKPIVGAPPANTPAAVAGISAGDEVRAVNGDEVASFQALRLALLRATAAGGTATLTLAGGQQATLTLPPLAEDLEQDTLKPLGIVRYDPEIAPVVGALVAGGVAERAGLVPGDRIVQANKAAVASWQGWVKIVRASPAKPLTLDIERAGKALTITLTPEVLTEGGERFGRVGVAPKIAPEDYAHLMTEVKLGPIAALAAGVAKTWDTSVFTLEMMGRMITGDVSWKNLSGPLTIADYAGQSAALGWVSFVSFLALVSISLGVLNLLPIPMLDGGHLMYYVAEVFTGRPVSERVMEHAGRVGMALLLMLMSFALFNDLQRLFAG